MRWTVPNILSIIRLLAAPFVAVMFLFVARPFADWVALILFVAASATDWVDGYLARAWKQETKFGAMIDPIADKAMVAIALLVLVTFSSLNFWIVLPAALILFREVFVSGLREFLGATAGTLKVTKLAKWKTASQMVAIAVLFSHGLFEHYLGMGTFGMDAVTFQDILAGRQDDPNGVAGLYNGMVWAARLGLVLIWVAGVLTLITGWDYLRKAMPHLRD